VVGDTTQPNTIPTAPRQTWGQWWRGEPLPPPTSVTFQLPAHADANDALAHVRHVVQLRGYRVRSISVRCWAGSEEWTLWIGEWVYAADGAPCLDVMLPGVAPDGGDREGARHG
jgi:hypothetical protein